MERYYSPRDVAKAIGVSESSLKRWADEGLLHVSRTAGGHRRIALLEALRYIRETGTPLLHPEILGLPALPHGSSPSEPLQDRESFLVDSIIRGDLIATRGALLGRYLAGENVGSLCDGPLREAFQKIGDLWRHGPEGIHVEHRATDTCIHGLNYLRGFLPAPPSAGLLALGGGAAGDPYLIPSLMAAVVLASEGWRDLNLGPNVPAAALEEAIRKFRPRLVWISFSHQEPADAELRALNQTFKLAEELGASVVVGGQGLQSGSRALAPTVHVLSSMQALAGFARGIATTHRPPVQETEKFTPDP